MKIGPATVSWAMVQEDRWRDSGKRELRTRNLKRTVLWRDVELSME